MTGRRWYRLHWVTWTALLFVGACLAWCGFVGSNQSLKYLWIGTRSFGWPWEHFDGLRDHSLARASANFAVWSFILIGVAAVLEPFLRAPARKPQFRLGTLLMVTAVIAILFALLKDEEDRNLQRYVPLDWYPVPVRLGVLVGVGCALFTAIRLAVRLVRRAAVRCKVFILWSVRT